MLRSAHPTDTVSKGAAPQLSVSISSATNRITTPGFAYDNAGDMTNENGPTYTWNAEEQITTAAGVTYTYDGDGLRVKKSNGKLYWRSIGIDVLAETDLAGNNPVEFIYFAGQRMAARDTAGQDYYIFSDHLGSARVITSATGAVCGDADYLPFGAERATYSCWVNYKFATYERDPETGLDYAIFRYYNSRLGRFMSPDLLAGRIANPQSLDRYTYVTGDPINRVDPLGLCTLVIGGGTQQPGTLSTSQQGQFAKEEGAIEVYPYSNLGLQESAKDMLQQEAHPTQSIGTVVAAINFAAQTNPGSPIDIVTVSAGAQVLSTALPYLSEGVRARINNVTHVSPATTLNVDQAAGSGSTTVFQGAGYIDMAFGGGFANETDAIYTAPCPHNMNCVFSWFGEEIREQSTSPCSNPGVVSAGTGRYQGSGGWYPVYSTFTSCSSGECSSSTYVWWIWLGPPTGPRRR